MTGGRHSGCIQQRLAPDLVDWLMSKPHWDDRQLLEYAEAVLRGMGRPGDAPNTDGRLERGWTDPRAHAVQDEDGREESRWDSHIRDGWKAYDFLTTLRSDSHGVDTDELGRALPHLPLCAAWASVYLRGHAWRSVERAVSILCAAMLQQERGTARKWDSPSKHWWQTLL